MLALEEVPGPAWKAVANGVRMLLRPADSSMLIAGRRAGREALADGQSEADAEFAFTLACVIWGTMDWEGIGDAAGDPVAPDAEKLEKLLRQNFGIFQKLDVEYVTPFLIKDAEKNASSPSPNGTLRGAKATARPAPTAAKSARTKPSRKPKRAGGSGV